MSAKHLFLLGFINFFLIIGVSMAQDEYFAVNKSTNLKEHVDKKIKISGKKTKFVAQHPIVTVPAVLAKDGKKELQSYLDTDFGQLIVVSQENIDCPNEEITLFGKLKHFSMGGKKDTKGSYSNYIVYVDKYECK
ncbi:MAG: hypothetical protein IPK14_00695 [Blastocatellia bacterium]|nr:hypothetical protein [Blastocatellia bacterium]